MEKKKKKEIEGLKQDIQSKEIAIEADKYMFESKLLNGLGESMMNELREPTKPSWWLAVKIKFARWRKNRKEEKERRQLLKQLNNNIKKEMGGF